MAKPGRAYEKFVADIVGTMSPGAKVEYGQLIVGPDGRRDLDVEIRGQINEEEQFIVIECKDWKENVGIGVVDALDSKRRDINADYALICSNSGFSADAIRKGKRVGIGMIAVLKSDDKNIKVVVKEEIYTKKIFIEDCKSICHFPDKLSSSKISKNCDPNDIKYNNLPVVNWIAEKQIPLVMFNPGGKKINAYYKFKKPLHFVFDSVSALVSAYEIFLQIRTTWMSQIISIDASLGVYDFIQHRTIMPPGREQQYKLNGVDFGKWKSIDFVPIERALDQNENNVSLSLIENSINKIGGVDTPDLDSLIAENILKVDEIVIKRSNNSIREGATKPLSGIEVLVNSIQGERIKLGRNELCYCDSRKKYKKCHGS
jgi:hypothetical protein